MPKLIRDKIPQIIKDSGREFSCYIAENKEYRHFLRKKLQEELNELLEDPCAEEMADLLEVVSAYANTLGITKEEIEKVGTAKRDERGGFACGIILEQVEDKKFLTCGCGTSFSV